MIAIIRISGMVDVESSIENALFRLRLRRKYALVLMNPTREDNILLKKLRNHISYGEISPSTLKKLIQHRAQSIDGKKVDADKVVEGLNKKSLLDLGIKPFFRLHPPRGGIESKKHFGVGKGVLGENKKINELIERML